MLEEDPFLWQCHAMQSLWQSPWWFLKKLTLKLLKDSVVLPPYTPGTLDSSVETFTHPYSSSFMSAALFTMSILPAYTFLSHIHVFLLLYSWIFFFLLLGIFTWLSLSHSNSFYVPLLLSISSLVVVAQTHAHCSLCTGFMRYAHLYTCFGMTTWRWMSDFPLIRHHLPVALHQRMGFSLFKLVCPLLSLCRSKLLYMICYVKNSWIVMPFLFENNFVWAPERWGRLALWVLLSLATQHCEKWSEPEASMCESQKETQRMWSQELSECVHSHLCGIAHMVV